MYKLKKNKDKGKFKKLTTIEGLVVKSKKGKVTLVSDELKNKYAIKMINKKLKTCYKKIFNFLTSEDDSESGIKACLGEIEKLKSCILNKYKEFLKDKEYKEFLAKTVITENEFKNKYHEREYFSKMLDTLYKSYEEDEIKGKSR